MSGTPRGAADRLTLAALVAVALNAGVFLTWSAMVMPAVRRLPTDAGVRAMQELNEAAPVPYSVVALPTAVVCVVVLVRGSGRLGSSQGWCMLGGGAIFLAAGLVVTFAANVPLSYSIDQLDTAGVSEEEWQRLAGTWTWFNHLRALGTTTAAVLLGLAVRSQRSASSPHPTPRRPAAAAAPPVPLAPPAGTWVPTPGSPTGR